MITDEVIILNKKSKDDDLPDDGFIDPVEETGEDEGIDELGLEEDTPAEEEAPEGFSDDIEE